MKSEIRNENFLKRTVDFTKLKEDGKMPTDIDAVIEFSDKLFIFIEFKHKTNTAMSVGQRVCYERICDRIQSTGVPCFVLQAEHNSNGRIEASTCIVNFYRYKKEWRPTKEPQMLGELIQKLKNSYLKG